MTGKAPTFTSGARVRVRINGKTVAHAVGVNVGFSVQVDPTYVMGEYGPIGSEVVGYSGVQGSIQILQVAPATMRQAATTIVSELVSNDTTMPNGTAPAIPNQEYRTAAQSTKTAIQDGSSLLSTENLALHLDPARVLLSRTFDLEFWLKVVDTTGKIVEVKQMTVQDARLTSRSASVAQGQVVGQQFDFMGILLLNPRATAAGSNPLTEQTDSARDKS